MYVLIIRSPDQVPSAIVCLVAEKPSSNAKHRTGGGCTSGLCQSFNVNRSQIVTALCTLPDPKIELNSLCLMTL